jgi:DNA-binding ferritin-like protein (Dps family)
MVGALYWVFAGLIAIATSISALYLRNYALGYGAGAINWDSIRQWVQVNVIDNLRNAWVATSSYITDNLVRMAGYFNWIAAQLNRLELILTAWIYQAQGLIEGWVIPRIATLEGWRDNVANYIHGTIEPRIAQVEITANGVWNYINNYLANRLNTMEANTQSISKTMWDYINRFVLDINNVSSKVDTTANKVRGEFASSDQWLDSKFTSALRDANTRIDQVAALPRVAWSDITAYVSNATSAVQTGLSAKIDSAIKAVNARIDALPTTTGVAWNDVVKYVTDATSALNVGLSAKIDSAIKAVNARIDALPTTTGVAWKDVTDYVTDATSALQATLNAKIADEVSKLNKRIDNLPTTTGVAWNDVVKYVTDATSALNVGLSAKIDSAIKAVNARIDALPTTTGVAWNDVTAYVDAISSTWESKLARVKEAEEAHEKDVADALEDELNKYPPETEDWLLELFCGLTRKMTIEGQNQLFDILSKAFMGFKL